MQLISPSHSGLVLCQTSNLPVPGLSWWLPAANPAPVDGGWKPPTATGVNLQTQILSVDEALASEATVKGFHGSTAGKFTTRKRVCPHPTTHSHGVLYHGFKVLHGTARTAVLLFPHRLAMLAF